MNNYLCYLNKNDKIYILLHMIIRKKFNVESAHIVRNCTSERCSHSIHGHSAVIEVFLESNVLDNAQMVYDFGLMKSTIKQFVDSMDHCYLLCANDSGDFKNFIKSNCDRWIELPFNPSAEMLSMFIFSGVDRILKNTVFKNGEDYIRVNSVRYHETTTGYAECNLMDVTRYNSIIDFDSIIYSEGVTKDWSNDLKSLIYDEDTVCNPVVEQQITLKNI